MAAPLIPHNLNPSGGGYIVASSTNTFTWDAQDQAEYYIEYKENIDTPASTTGWVVSADSEHSFAKDTFTVNKEYVWRVKVKNATNDESSFSEWAVFKGGGRAELTITFPEKDFDVVDSMPTYTHLYTNPNDQAQLTLRYRLYTGKTWDEVSAMTKEEQESHTWNELEIDELLYDSGEIESDTTEHPQPAGYFESLEYYYKVRCNIRNAADEELEADIRTYYLSLTDIPPTPTITVTPDNDEGAILIEVTNPTPDPGQPPAESNVIYRSTDDVHYSTIDLLNGYDYTCNSGKKYYYKAAAVANGIEGYRSEAAEGVITLSGYVITNLETGESWNITLGAEMKPIFCERDRSEQIGLDSKRPIVTYGERKFKRGGLQGVASQEYATDDDIATQTARLIALLDADDKKPLQLRTPAGETYTIDTYNVQYVPLAPHDRGRIISFEFVEVDE